MNDQVEAVKSKVDIVAVINEHVPLSKAGRNFKGLCPFHSEKSPSFMVSSELQIYKCFGCGESGDVFSFLEKYEGLEFSDALKLLAERAGVKLKPIAGAKNENDIYFEANDLAARFYNWILLNHKLGEKALEYLKKGRGLTLETIKEFNLGYAPENPTMLVNFLERKKKIPGSVILKSGLAYQGRGGPGDRFRGRIIFPLYDHRGKVVGLAGRVLPGSPFESRMAKYINSPESPIYHKSRVLYGLNLSKKEIKKKGSALVVEGELDMISPWQKGIKNVVAIKGTAFTGEQVSLLSRFTNEVVMALDSDFAGDNAARKGIALANEAGLEVKVLETKNFKDPDEFVKEDLEGFKKAITNAVGAWDYVIKLVFQKFDASSGAGKGKIAKELTPILSSIPDRVVREHYIEVVARKLHVSFEAIMEGIKGLGTSNKIQISPEEKKEETPQGRRKILEEELLALLIQVNPEMILEKRFDLFVTPLATKLSENLREFLKKEKKFNLGQFAKRVPAELSEALQKMAMEDFGEALASDGKFQRELSMLFYELSLLDAKEKLSALADKITSLEEGEEDEKLEEVKKRVC